MTCALSLPPGFAASARACCVSSSGLASEAQISLCSQNYAFTYNTATPVVAIPIEDQFVQMQINLSPPTNSVVTDPNYGELRTGCSIMFASGYTRSGNIWNVALHSHHLTAAPANITIMRARRLGEPPHTTGSMSPHLARPRFILVQ